MIDIIIVNYNSTDYLLKCLESVYSDLQGIPVHIWVEDNASVDGVHRIKNRFSEVNLTCHHKNLGFAAAVNHALKKGAAPYVVLLNPDSLLQKNFFRTIIPFMESNPNIAIAGPQILDADGSVQGSARAFPTPLTALFGRSSLFSRIFPDNPITRSNILTARSNGIHPIEVDWVSGACMIIRRQAIEVVGGFDERFFMYWEDADWCRRMQECGWKVVYYPQASVVHHVGVSSSQFVVKSRFEFHKSVYRLFEKYNPDANWLLKIMVMSCLGVRFGLLLIIEKIMLFAGASSAFPQSVANEKKPKEKIKVMRLIARLNVGGPAIHVHLLTTGLNPKHFETLLVTGMISRQEGDMGYLFHDSASQLYQLSEMQRDIRISMDLQVIFHIFQLIIRFQPDIVHTHTAKAGFTARITVFFYNLFFRKNIKIVHTFHGHVFEGYFSPTKSWAFVQIERFLAWISDVIIAISESQRNDLVEKYQIASPEKIRTIELGFNLDPFMNCARLKGRFRKMLGVRDETILVGIVGRLVPIKHHQLFFEAAQQLLKAHPGIDIQFVVVGDGECRNELETYCKRFNLTPYVYFSGWIQQVSMVYADLDILALTSLNEGTPVSIIEAMASSVPVIATNVGGIQDLLGKSNELMDERDGFIVSERGVLIRTNDSTAFFRGLTHLLNEEKDVRKARLERAHTYVVQRYSKERLIDDMESLYHELLCL